MIFKKKAIAMFTYDHEASAVYVKLSTYYKDLKNLKTWYVDVSDVNLDVNENNEVVGIEMLFKPYVPEPEPNNDNDNINNNSLES